MSCNDKRSIPDGCGIMVYDLEIDLKRPLIDNIGEIPLREPVALEIRNKQGQVNCLVKTITLLDAVYERFRLTAYNPAPEYGSRWIPINCIEKIYKVLQVISNEELMENS